MVALTTWAFDSAGNHWAAGWETGRIASHLAEGNGYSMELGRGWTSLEPTAWLAPLYPALVGAIFTVLGSFSSASLILVLVLQAACDGGTCVQLTRIGGKLGYGRAGILAGALFALSPASLNMSVRIIWCTSFLTFLCATLILRFLSHGSANEPESPRAFVATGLLIGVVLLTSPTPAFFVGFVSLLLIAKNPARNVRAVSTMAVVASLVVAPWIARNTSALGSVFFVKSNIGNELFIGNNATASGEYVRAYDTALAVLTEPELRELQPMNELERADALGGHAMAWIRKHPEDFARLTLHRFWIYWTAPFLDRWELLPLGPLQGVVPIAYTAARWLILLAACVGGILLIRTRQNAMFLIGFLALFPIAYYLTHAGIARYRFPVIPGLYLLAAITVETLVSRRGNAAHA